RGRGGHAVLVGHDLRVAVGLVGVAVRRAHGLVALAEVGVRAGDAALVGLRGPDCRRRAHGDSEEDGDELASARHRRRSLRIWEPQSVLARTGRLGLNGEWPNRASYPETFTLRAWRASVRRSSSVVPPQIPNSCRVLRAKSKHSGCTGQVAQIVLAHSMSGTAAPVVPSGKNS